MQVLNITLFISFIFGSAVLIYLIDQKLKQENYEQSEFYKQTDISYEKINDDKLDKSDSEVLTINELKGAYQEYLICNIINKTIKGKNNLIYRNVYIPKSDGSTSEIDVLFVTPMGIFVIESKNTCGWIYGGEKDKHWTYAYRNNKRQMTNPIIQNRNHINYLKRYLNLPNYSFNSLIVFSNNANLRKVPEGNHNYIICKLDDLSYEIYNKMINYDHSISDFDFSIIKEKLDKIVNVSSDVKKKHKERILLFTDSH